jgi:dihydroneopterin aldolase/2-amino-4-hydroxy-6-hydroxymethyldihydropteridine diphosphokinase
MREARRLSVAFVAVGSNVEPRQNIVAALTLLQEKVRVRASSTFYRTQPLGGRRQPDFINGVWRIESDLSDVQLKNEVLAAIESRLGRVRTADRFAPRTIDLDLVLYSRLVTNDDGLTLPHPDVQRPFVFVPILELLDSAVGEIEPDLLAAMRALLPRCDTVTAAGEPLDDLTAELRRLLA